jgi:hypothetical protein
MRSRTFGGMVKSKAPLANMTRAVTTEKKTAALLMDYDAIRR